MKTGPCGSYGGVFLGTDLLVEGNTAQTCRQTLGRNWLGWGFSTNAHTGTDPNIFVSTTKCHQQGFGPTAAGTFLAPSRTQTRVQTHASAELDHALAHLVGG